MAKNKSDENVAGVADPFEMMAVSLRKATVFCCLLYIALRPLGVGLEVAEPEAGVLLCLSLAGCVFYLLSAAVGGALPLPRLRVALPLVAFGGLAALAVFGSQVSYAQLSEDLGTVWMGDLFILIAVAGSARWQGVRRAYLCALVAGSVVAGLYALYQYLFAGAYLKRIFELAGSSASMSESMLEGFNIRLGSSRVGGPYAYANALAGVCLVMLPLAWRWAVPQGSTDKPNFQRGLLLLPLVLGMVLSGSKAGFAACKLAEWLTLTVIVFPKAQRVKSLLATGGVAAMASLVSAAVAAGVYLALGSGAGLLVFALLWWMELLLLPILMVRVENRLKTIASAAFVLGIVLFLAGSVYVFRSGESAPQPVRKIKERALANLTVRYNYWVAAANVIEDHPLRGVGLDNFGEYYSQYKQPEGWEVKRVHNQYLQLAADGGVPLLVAYLLLWVGILWPRKKSESCAENPVVMPEGLMYKFGMACGVSAFVLSYLYFLGNTFTGLGIEYFFSELGKAQGSYLAEGSPFGLLIHGGVNLLVLPGCWMLGFHFAYRKFSRMDEPFSVFLLIGMAALLLHAGFDFILYHTVVSGVLWVIAGCYLSGVSGKMLQIGTHRKRVVLAAAFGVPGLLLLIGYAYPWLGAVSDKSLADKLQYSPETLKDQKYTLNLYETALRSRPQEAQLRASYASVLWAYGMHAKAIRQVREAVKLQPLSASLHLRLGEMLQRVNPASPEIVSEFTRAVELYPFKSLYRLQLAQALLRSGQKEQAADMARKALEISAETTDNRAKLTDAQKTQAQAIAGISG